MANIMSLNELRNQPHRNGFDLSFRNVFSAKVGEILPVVCKAVMPGDKFKLRTSWFTRTQPVNTAAFTRIREYYDWYFVPYHILWSYFPDWITQMNDPQFATSNVQRVNLDGSCPYVSSQQIVNRLNAKKNVLDYFGFSSSEQSVKLLQYLGYGDYNNVLHPNGNILDDSSTFNLNIFPLLAYQKICQDYFRNQQWETSEPYLFNVNYLNNSSTKNYTFPESSISKDIMQLNYCLYPKDYFTGLLPNQQFGDTAVASPIVGELNASSFSLHFNNTPSAGNDATGYGALQLDSKNQYNNAGLTVLALRQAEFLQKWKEIVQSGDKSYKDQMEKIFGVKVHGVSDHTCKYIGGTAANIDIGEVVNTALNVDSDKPTAEIQGKGIGSGDGFCDFEASEHGILMCIYHALPLLDYNASQLRRENTHIYAADFPNPVFDSIGMQPTYGYEIFYAKGKQASNTAHNTSNILGYAPRYVECKTSIDEVHGSFFNGGMESYVAPITAAFMSSTDSSDSSAITKRILHVNPSVVDSIFGTNAIPESNSTLPITATDCLLINSNFDIKAVRNLSRTGMPY